MLRQASACIYGWARTPIMKSSVLCSVGFVLVLGFRCTPAFIFSPLSAAASANAAGPTSSRFAISTRISIPGSAIKGRLAGGSPLHGGTVGATNSHPALMRAECNVFQNEKPSSTPEAMAASNFWPGNPFTSDAISFCCSVERSRAANCLSSCSALSARSRSFEAMASSPTRSMYTPAHTISVNKTPSAFSARWRLDGMKRISKVAC
jgi:hypothetical protein